MAGGGFPGNQKTPLDTPLQHPYKREQCADRKCPRLRVRALHGPEI